jgi:membrane protein YdbS with pleckstrin-like domain
MQEFDHIEALWAAHTVDVKISADEMLKQAKKEVNGMRTKSLLNIGGMILSFLAIAAVWLLLDFSSWTTHAGISIIIVVIAVYTIILYNNYRIISKSDFTVNPNDFIARLKLYQVSRLAIYNRLYWFYVIALSLGMTLYFVEVLDQLERWVQILALTLSFGWIIFCSTLLRKAIIKRDKERIALLIEKFERISGQFHEHVD